jgi:hypothetical protein
MRAVVALVEARPETIIEDYHRVLELAGLGSLVSGSQVALVAQIRSGSWFPGAGSPPWQIDGVLSWLDRRHNRSDSLTAGGPAAVLAASPERGPASPAGWAWEDVMARFGAEPASEHFRRPRSFRAEPPLPALEAHLKASPTLPAGLRDRASLFLPVPVWDPWQPVTASVDLLRSALVPTAPRIGNGEDGEIQADVLRFAGQCLPGFAVVMDAVLWQVGRQPEVTSPVARNVLLAGRDPVAVDAVATRLIGRDPGREAWFRLCRDQGLGMVRDTDIRLVGRAELLALDFGMAGHGSSWWTRNWTRIPLAGQVQRKIKSSSLLKEHALTPWGGLFEAYRTGGPGRDEK